MSKLKVTICGAGFKAPPFLTGVLERGLSVDRVVSYDVPGDISAPLEKIRHLCATNQIPLLESRNPTQEVFVEADLIFLVGWQFLISFVTDKFVVFHDSLLPRYRGFAPTVTALIKGDPVIGVSAITPANGIDTGPILAQASMQVTYPTRIEDALIAQTALMVDLAMDILRDNEQGTVEAIPQNDQNATYSVWRDGTDYWVDWTSSAEQILRFVDSVGYPYEGARTCANGATVTIDKCRVVEDLNFETRHPGKVWRIIDGHPLVICGSGLLEILEMHGTKGQEFTLDRLRTRLGPPPGAQP